MGLFLFSWKFSWTPRTYCPSSSHTLAHLLCPHHSSSVALTSPHDRFSCPVSVCTKVGQLESPLKLTWTNCFTLHCDRVKLSMLSYHFLSATEATGFFWNWTGTHLLLSKNWCHKNRAGLANGLGIFFLCFPKSDFSWASSSPWVSVLILFLSLKTVRLHFQNWHVAVGCYPYLLSGYTGGSLPPGFPVIRASGHWPVPM